MRRNSHMRLCAIPLCLVMCLGQASADEWDVLRQKLVDEVALGTYFNTSDADVTTYNTVADKNIKSIWESMEKSPTTYLWSSYNKLKASGSYTPEEHIRSTYFNLLMMARGYANPISTYFQNADILADVKMGLDFMNSYAYNKNTLHAGGWYTWTIGIPEYYGQIMILLYDQLTETQLSNYDTAVGTSLRNTVATGNLTFANQANVCQELMIMGIILKKTADVQSALNNSVKVFVDPSSVADHNTAQTNFDRLWAAQGDYHNYNVLKKEGYYPDGTFIQHIAIPYIMAYGLEMPELSSLYARVLQGSSFTIPQQIIDALPSIIVDTYSPALYKGEAMMMYMGRNTNADPFHNGAKILLFLSETASLLQDTTLRDYVIATCREQLKAGKITYTHGFNPLTPYREKPHYMALMQSTQSAPTDTVFCKAYACGDRVVHQTKTFRFGLSMSSNRIGKFECINNANKKGWYEGDGMTYIYLPTDRKQYKSYFSGSINWYRLPGTTVDTKLRTDETDNYGLFGVPNNAKDRVGCASLKNRYGIAMMDLVSQISDMEALKSWFMFDDEIVCLGAGITMSEDRAVESIIEQRYSKDSLKINDIHHKTKGVTTTFPQTNYVSLRGTGGYYFPTPQDINAYISYDGYTMLYFDHDKAPKGATYSYVLLPGMNNTQTATYAANPKVEILSNTKQIQAVRQTQHQVTGICFWQDGKFDAVSVDKAALVMFQQQNDTLHLTLAEPTQKASNLQVVLDGEFQTISLDEPTITSIQVEGSKTYITLNLTNRWGRHVELTLKGVLPSAIKQMKSAEDKVKKRMENGQLIIYKNHHKYSVFGQKLR